MAWWVVEWSQTLQQATCGRCGTLLLIRSSCSITGILAQIVLTVSHLTDHFSNVDRLWALWQVAHPNVWMENYNIGSNPTFVLPASTIVNGSTPLSPFWRTQNEFWTSDQVRDTQALGYVYPETMNWTFNSAQEYQVNVNATIAKLYSNSARARLVGSQTEAVDEVRKLVKGDTYTDWNIDVGMASATISSTFSIRFSFVSASSSDAAVDVGRFSLLRPANHDASHKRSRNVALQDTSLITDIEGHISLTANLIDEVAAGKLLSLEPGDVVPFLKDSLSWTTLGADGRAVADDEVQGLQMIVSSRDVKIPADEGQMLEYGTSTSYPELTAGERRGTRD
jgi:tyrosinase